MEVEIPANVRVGDVIGVVVPDGRQATLKVPEGSVPGSTLRLMFDPIAGTLSTIEREPTGLGGPAGPEGQELSVEVPAGVGAGHLLGVTVPDGRQLNVTIPRGAVAGSALRLWFDPRKGTLSVMP
jgi:hypothetical protein